MPAMMMGLRPTLTDSLPKMTNIGVPSTSAVEIIHCTVVESTLSEFVRKIMA